MDIHLRPAEKRDAQALFAWRNDGETRHQSRHTGPIEWDEHEKWFADALESGSSHFCIAENAEGERVGTVRADEQVDGSMEIAYTIAPSFRGMHLSKPMVQRFANEYLRDKKIVAHIKKGHGPSEAVARMLGLAPVAETPSDDSADKRPMVEWR